MKTIEESMMMRWMRVRDPAVQQSKSATVGGEDGAVVARRFLETTSVHIVKNHLASLDRVTLILAIQGRMGEGKSFQIRQVCKQLGVKLFVLSGSSLAGSHEGDSIERLQHTYRSASKFREVSGRLAAILIDDFDRSAASTLDGVKYTVNSQLLTGFLMNLSDEPSNCGGERCLRVPIILTGNNFTSVYAPLARHGRMNFFEWSPTVEEKVAVVKHLLADVVADPSSIETICNEYESQPIAFFAALKEDYLDEVILREIQASWSIDLESIADALHTRSPDRDLILLRQLAERRYRSTAQNFIRR